MHILLKNSPKNHSESGISDGAEQLQTLSKEFCLTSGVEKIDNDIKRQNEEAANRHEEVLQKMASAS